MSEQKKEIHVKDLVIKADNVIFEPPKTDTNPFFGPRRRFNEEVEGVSENIEESDKNLDDDREQRIPPFLRL